MDNTQKIVGWIVTLLIIVFAISWLNSSMDFASIAVILGIAVVWAPPVREFVFKKTKLSVNIGIRFFFSFVLFILALNLVTQTQTIEEAKAHAALKVKKVEAFRNNPEPVLARIRKKMDAGKWAEAVYWAEYYSPTDNHV